MVARYGDSLGDALGFAAWLHREQTRKRSTEEQPAADVPYLTDLLDVTSLAIARYSPGRDRVPLRCSGGGADRRVH